MEVYFSKPEQISNNMIRFDADEANHIVKAKRHRVGDRIRVVDGHGMVYSAEITLIGKGRATAEILEQHYSDAEPDVNIYVAQSLPKGKKFEAIVDHCTQIGVKQFIPFTSERTIVNYDAKKAKKNRARWQRIAISAMKQSGRAFLPEISEIMSYRELLTCSDDYDLSLIASAFQQEIPLKKILQIDRSAKNILLIIGPEGGFSETEIESAKEKNCKAFTLGKRVFRVELAGVVISSIILYELGI